MLLMTIFTNPKNETSMMSLPTDFNDGSQYLIVIVTPLQELPLKTSLL